MYRYACMNVNISVDSACTSLDRFTAISVF